MRLPEGAGTATLPFLMHPNCEYASGRFNALAQASFVYTSSAHAIRA